MGSRSRCSLHKGLWLNLKRVTGCLHHENKGKPLPAATSHLRRTQPGCQPPSCVRARPPRAPSGRQARQLSRKWVVLVHRGH
ncbi:hypothetical protein D623_10010310 [Myotis brandtii]|uniref:Uncharacterized protein n=1 Tax=Myotis brandtii TaxID=109478 RepID=S7NIE3_MYOBR|nr:hypothetical protein D623_10010310 [Myotis brandtii]